jgi:hypothetical protein
MPRGGSTSPLEKHSQQILALICEHQYGAPWGSCGKRLVADAPMGRWETVTFIAGLRRTGIVAPMVIKGAMNGESFLTYMEQCLAHVSWKHGLVPTLKRGDARLARSKTCSASFFGRALQPLKP